VPREYTAWLAGAARRTDLTAVGSGLLDGLYGTAWVLDLLGAADAARDTLDRAGQALTALAPASAAIGDGTAGAALVLLHFGETEAAGRLASAAPPEAPGLLDGAAGTALLRLRLHAATGEEHWLRAAREALAAALARCVFLDDGTVHVVKNGRHLPYLGGGSTGVALVARAWLAAAATGGREADDVELTAFVTGARRLGSAGFVREPGLIHGRAGVIGGLGDLGGTRADIAAQTARLAWHAVARDGAVRIPGTPLLRYSADLATGAAGVLLAVHTGLTDGGFLDALLPGASRPGPARGVRTP
jgi:hypothetical protein